MEAHQGVGGQAVADERVTLGQHLCLIEGHVDGQDDASGRRVPCAQRLGWFPRVMPLQPDDVFAEMLLDRAERGGVLARPLSGGAGGASGDVLDGGEHHVDGRVVGAWGRTPTTWCS